MEFEVNLQKSIHTSDYEVFLRLLRRVRAEAGLTQSELAQRLGQTQSFVSKVERGERRLDVVELRWFCDAMGVPLVEFVDRFERELG